MTNPLKELLNPKTPDVDLAREAQELQDALAPLCKDKPSRIAMRFEFAPNIRKTDNPEPSPATDPRIAEFRKPTRSGESQ
jgi:hypothetical protein